MRSVMHVGGRPRAMAVLGMLALLVGACAAGEPEGADPPPQTPSPTADDGDEPPAGGPRAGGTLVFAQAGNPLTLDPGLIRGTQGTLPEAQVAAPIFDPLLYQVVETGEVKGLIAESMDTEDGVTWTLRLRDGVRFHDGTDLDAEAVKFNWERTLDEELGSPHRSLVEGIESLTVVDPLTLEIVLAEANTQFHRSVAQQLAFIGSPTAIQELGEGFAQNPVGAGPFRFVEWISDDRLVLERNDDYWNAPEPYLDQVVFRPLPDAQQALNAVSTGDVTAMHSADSGQFARAEELGLQVTFVDMHGGTSFAMNYAQAPFDDLRARQAVSYGFDLERHNQVVNNGLQEVAEKLFSEGHELYNDVPLHTYDPDRAQELFNEIAAELGGPVPIEIGCFPGTGQERMCESLQSQMLEYDNVRATVDVVDSAEANRRFIAREYQIHLFGIQLIDAEPLLYSYLHSHASLNAVGWNNPEVDQILEAGRRTVDAAARRDLYEQLSEIWAEEVPQILTFRSRTYRFSDAVLQGQSWFQNNWVWGPLWLDQ